MNNAKWFDRGAQAVAWWWPEYQDHYVCPLCTRVFPRAQLGELTFDHVPPKSLGGQKIVLTCHACNSRSGHKLDHHMRTEQDVVEFGLGTPSRPQRTTVELGGYELTAEVVTSGDTIQIFGLPKSNHPDASRKFVEKLGRLSEDGQWQGQSISLSMKRKFDHKSTQVGYLRAAYLAGFAVFGYSYIRSPALQAVRTQILDPDSEHVYIPIGTSPTANRSDRRIILIREPRHFGAALRFKWDVTLSCCLDPWTIRDFISELVMKVPGPKSHHLALVGTSPRGLRSLDIFSISAKGVRPRPGRGSCYKSISQSAT